MSTIINMEDYLFVLLFCCYYFFARKKLKFIFRKDKSFKIMKQREKLSLVHIRSIFQMKIREKDKARLFSRLPTLDFKKSESKALSTSVSTNERRNPNTIVKIDKMPNNLIKLRRGLTDTVLCKYIDGEIFLY